MIISNLDIVGVAFPSEANSPLIIDPDAPLAIAVTGKLLQSVPRRDSQKVEAGSAAQLFELALGDALNVLRQLRRKSPMEQLLSLFAGE